MKSFVLSILLSWGVCLFSLAQTEPSDSPKSVFLDAQKVDSVRYEAGFNYVMSWFRKNLDSARVAGHELLTFSKNSKNQKWEATAYRLIGNTYAIQGKFEKAKEFFLNSHDILLELGDKKGLATTYNNIGTVYYELGNYPEAQTHLLESLKLAEQLEDSTATSRALNNLGNVHNDLRNNEQALDYYTKSLRIKEKLGQKRRLPAAYNNIGLIYTNLRNHELAIQNLTKSAQIAKEIGDQFSFTRAYSNIGIQYSENGDYDKALEYLNESIRIKKEINDMDGLGTAYAYRGVNYLAMKRYALALSDCEKSLEMSKTSGAVHLQGLSSGCLSDAHEALGNYERSLQYQRLFVSLKDSLFNKERTQEITRAEMNYQFEKKQLADSIAFHKLQTQQQVAYERNLNKQNQKFYILLLVSLGVISFLVFLYWKYQQNLKLKKMENQLLVSDIEYKKKDLTTLAVNISNNKEWAESLASRLEVLKASTGRKRLKELEALEEEIKNKIWVNKDSDDFYQKVDSLSSAFYNRLTTRFEGLSKTDVRLCSFVKLGLNTKQIATLQNINPSSVKMSRNRLRKKLNLTPEDDLDAFLRAF